MNVEINKVFGKSIYELNEETGRNVAILADLQGPKLRVGVMKDAHLNNGDVFTFTTEQCTGDSKKAYMTYQTFPQDVKPGENILVDDGKLMFEVLKSDGKTTVTTKVIRGGELKSKVEINAHAFTKTAQKAIEAAGGVANII